MAGKRSHPRQHPLASNAGPLRLLNIGPKSSAWLADAGIRTRDELARLGAIEACRRMRAAGHPATLNAAYAIEAGLRGEHWLALPPEIKRDLVARFRELERAERASR